MRSYCCAAVFVALGTAAAASFEVRTDLTNAPDGGEYAERAKSLCVEWYPKINEILYGPGVDLPYREVVITFGRQNIVGFTEENVIHISSDWIRQKPKDYDALVIHELTHVAQEYTAAHFRHDRLLAFLRPLRIRRSQAYRMNWLAEGVADYVRWKCYKNELEPRLRLNDAERAKLRDKGYKRGYRTAATFLLWLETQKDPAILRKLNEVLKQRRYSPKVFEANCGAPLDKLWAEFLAQSVRTESSSRVGGSAGY